MNNYFVITGGPGVGKTTLIHALAQRGYNTVQEDARQIIKDQVAVGADGVPWSNKKRYAELMMKAAVFSFTEMQKIKTIDPIFFDRGLLDVICYMSMENLPICTDSLDTINRYRYNKYVFILPPWPEIYTTDDERKQEWHEVMITHESMKSTYERQGYVVIEVPRTDVEKRCDFILYFLKENCKLG